MSPSAVGIALFAILLLSTSQRVTPTVASAIIRERLSLTGSEFGVLAGVSALVFGLMQFPGGHLSDVFGAVRMIKIGAVVSAAGTLIFLIAPNYPLALAGRVVFGTADSVVFVSMMRYAVARSAQGGALQIGNVQAGVATGFAGTALVGLGLTSTSFPLIFGALVVLQALIAIFIPAPHRSQGGAVAVEATAAEVLGLARTKQFWASVLGNIGLFAPFLAWTSGWAVPYLVSVTRLTTDQARLVVVADSLAAAAGALLLGLLSDVLRRRRLLILSGSAAMTAAWAVTAAITGPGVVWLTIAMTLLAAFSFPACSSALVLAKESYRADRAGMVLGLSNAGSSVSAALLGAAAGAGLDTGWRGAFEHGIRVYPAHAFVAVPVALLIGSALGLLGGLLARETHGVQATYWPGE